ncbi:MAG TPA: heme NO-binding domain-containing protein, partial [Longimicrobium sp.]|nr:heme NO-binding domain-containing protein [Longimicrobium sp.]
VHGIIFSELKKYVDAKLGPGAWSQLAANAGLGVKVYLPIREYPDEELVALVATASGMTGIAAQDILVDFGEFIAPSLLRMYRSLVKPEWRTLDLVENVEQTIHTVVRIKNPGARPPELHTTRVGPREVLLTYTSARKLCSVARGIVNGVSRHYGDRIEVTESVCMLQGADRCELTLRQLA